MACFLFSIFAIPACAIGLSQFGNALLFACQLIFHSLRIEVSHSTLHYYDNTFTMQEFFIFREALRSSLQINTVTNAASSHLAQRSEVAAALQRRGYSIFSEATLVFMFHLFDGQDHKQIDFSTFCKFLKFLRGKFPLAAHKLRNFRLTCLVWVFFVSVASAV
jgi:hypothetical protein